MFDLTDKVVLLTGATGGIGKSIAKRMKEKAPSLSFLEQDKTFLMNFLLN